VKISFRCGKKHDEKCLFSGPTSLLKHVEHPKFSIKKSTRIFPYLFLGYLGSKANRFERTSLGDIAGGAIGL